jgi:membrane-bound inhibitor of C-type lysozyme
VYPVVGDTPAIASRSVQQDGGMTTPEERQLAQDRIRAHRAESYDVLVATYVNRSTHEQVIAASGARYDVQVQAFWDGPRSPGRLRVRVAIDAIPVSR